MGIPQLAAPRQVDTAQQQRTEPGDGRPQGPAPAGAAPSVATAEDPSGSAAAGDGVEDGWEAASDSEDVFDHGGGLDA